MWALYVKHCTILYCSVQYSYAYCKLFIRDYNCRNTKWIFDIAITVRIVGIFDSVDFVQISNFILKSKEETGVTNRFQRTHKEMRKLYFMYHSHEWFVWSFKMQHINKKCKWMTFKKFTDKTIFCFRVPSPSSPWCRLSRV